MGYYVELVASNVLIPKYNVDKAYQAVQALQSRNDLKRGGSWGAGGVQIERWFSWMPADLSTLKTLADVLDALGFSVNESSKGDLYIDNYDSKTGQEDLFFEALAPYITTAADDWEPVMLWRGEDGAEYRWVFRNGRMVTEYRSDVWTNLS